MINVVIEEPYRFVPPLASRRWPAVIRRIVPWHLRRTSGIRQVETRHAERLRDSLRSGCAALLAPNHCRLSDPLTFSELCVRCGCDMHAMASWHLFKESRLNCFMLRRIGAFSVHRESVDRQAINAAVDIMVEGRRPLVVFAEGAISRHNDVLMPMMDGPSFIARTAAKRREKAGLGPVVIHPIAIRYFFKGNLEATVAPVLAEIESHFSWHDQSGKPLVQRIRQIGQALLSLKEIEYLGWARTGDFYERLDHLIDDVLRKIERRTGLRNGGDSVVTRVKAIRMTVLPRLLDQSVDDATRRILRKDLAACHYLQQMSHYPRNYVRASAPNVPEHILETVERFEEDFTDRVRVHSPLDAVVDVGEPISVDGRRDRSGPGDPIMDQLRTTLQGMLDALSAESPRI